MTKKRNTKQRPRRPALLEPLERRELLSASYAIFNESYYLAHNPDVAAAVSEGQFTSGLQHFQEYGMYEDRAPSALWDETFYLAMYPDLDLHLASQGISPVEHFILYGDAEGRTPTPIYSPNYYYVQNNPDVTAAVANGTFVSGFDHFVLYGDKEERSPSVTMNADWYLASNPDVANAVQLGTISSATDHFLAYGQFEGREPSPFFDQSYYLAQNPGVQAEITSGKFVSAFEQWRSEGLLHGYVGSPAAYQIQTIVGADEAPVAISSRNVVIGTTEGVSSAAGQAVGGASNLAGINATDVAYYGVVGQSISSASTGVAAGRAVFRKTDGTLLDIGNLSDGSASPVNSTIPTAITDNSYVVGDSMVWNSAADIHQDHPFIWDEGDGITDLGLPAAPAGYSGSDPYYTDGYANSVNVRRVVVGRVVVNSSILPATQYAFIWTPQNGFTVFTNYSNFLDVNDFGLITAQTQAGASVVVDMTGAVIGLAPLLPGAPSGTTSVISNTGVAVGYSVDPANPNLQHTTVTIHDKTYLLDDLFYNNTGASSIQFVGQGSINALGDIAAQAIINGSQVITLILSPTVVW